jgi:hypothetical protein
MKAPLGTDFVQNFKFTHYLKKPIVYACRIEKLGSKVLADPKAKVENYLNKILFINYY